MTRVVRHKESGKFARIDHPDVCYDGVLVDTPKEADIFNEELDHMEDRTLLKFVAYADFEEESITSGDVEAWEIVPVKVTVTIEE